MHIHICTYAYTDLYVYIIQCIYPMYICVLHTKIILHMWIVKFTMQQISSIVNIYRRLKNSRTANTLSVNHRLSP
jgi:hypothetical protein